MPHFDPITARLILALERYGSIAKTAEHENIAPSAVSRRIADLESRLDTVLLDRSASGVKLTKAGEAYTSHCRRIFREIADLDSEMTHYVSGEQGELRIAASSSALSGRLPELLADFARGHKGIRLDIREMGAGKALSVLEDAQVDMAVIADNYDFTRFDTFPFEDDHVWVIAPREHPLGERIAKEKRLAFSDVMGHEIVGIHHMGALDRLLNEAAKTFGRTLASRVNVESFASLVRMVEAGFGIGFLRHSCLHLLAGTDLVGARLTDAWALRQLVAATRKKAGMAAPMKAFLRQAKSSYTPLP
ncbi:LysR family transcriptional regulator [Mesorhizobium sp. SB112]|uniref:LysR family transcriptional regulator n=1 Tax=Mesorhizobium sp. SB112 TaxID=3151853 RepID=UPI0032677508